MRAETRTMSAAKFVKYFYNEVPGYEWATCFYRHQGQAWEVENVTLTPDSVVLDIGGAEVVLWHMSRVVIDFERLK